MRFSPKRVCRREWVALGSGLGAVAANFLPWTSLSSADPVIAEALRELPAGEVVRNAWTTGFLAWSGPVLVLLTGIAVVLFGQSRTARVSGLPHLWLVAVAVAAVLMALSWLAIDHQFGEDVRALLQDGGIEIAGGPGRYLALVAALASLVMAGLDIRASRRRS